MEHTAKHTIYRKMAGEGDLKGDMKMQNSNHFVEIRPKGSQRQYTLEERQSLADDMNCATVEQADAINDARTAFAAECGLPHSRTKYIGYWDIRRPSSTAIRKPSRR